PPTGGGSWPRPGRSANSPRPAPGSSACPTSGVRRDSRIRSSPCCRSSRSSPRPSTGRSPSPPTPSKMRHARRPLSSRPVRCCCSRTCDSTRERPRRTQPSAGTSPVGWPSWPMTSSPTDSASRSEERTSELQSRFELVCRLQLVTVLLTATPVPYTTLFRSAADTVEDEARAKAAELAAGEVLLLENLRFNPGETSKDEAERRDFAGRLAELADDFVSDGFGVEIGRAHV